jgi:hypothetical protein
LTHVLRIGNHGLTGHKGRLNLRHRGHTGGVATFRPVGA